MEEDHKTNAVRIASEKLDLEPVFLDSETTGIDAKSEIVDIAIVGFDGEILVDSLVKPKKRIPKDAINIHRITNEMVANAPSWSEIWPKIRRILSGRAVGIYNADFDIRLLKQTTKASHKKWALPYANYFYIMELYAIYHGEWNDYHKSYTWQSLKNAALQSGIALQNTHRAKDDTLLARAVLYHMGGKDWSEKIEAQQNSVQISNVESPEEQELDAKRERLEELEEILATKELELVTLQSELIYFQDIYLRTVGVKIAQLDELEAKIAEFLSKKFSADKSHQTEAKEAREKAKSSSHANEYVNDELEKERFIPTEELKSQFWNLAKKIHPDLAVDEKDRAIREEFMKRANEAYQNGDSHLLHEMENEWLSNPTHIKGEDVGAELVRVIRIIASVEKRILKIDDELDILKQSEYFELKSEYEKAKAENRDLLKEMKAHLEEQIERKESEYDELVKE